MLRRLGYRVAVDDRGGNAGLASFGQLQPDVVKLDMALVRSIESSATKASIVRSMISVCTEELGTEVVCEGVETAAERDVLYDLGARLLQGTCSPNRREVSAPRASSPRRSTEA